MKKLFEIKHRFTGKVIFNLECTSLKACVEMAVETGADLRGADLRDADLRGASLGGAYLSGADLRGTCLSGASLGGAYLSDAYLSDADLRGAYLRGASLGGAYLSGADLRDADLRGASLGGASFRGAYLSGADLSGAGGEKIESNLIPIQILGLRWNILILDSHIKIGCELHSIKEWAEFDDETINKMASGALKFWEKSRGFIMDFCKANGRG